MTLNLDPTLRIAGEFCASFSLDDYSTDVADHAQLVLLDTVGAVLAGWMDPVVRKLASGLAELAPDGSASALGIRNRVPATTAAFLNGTAGTWEEVDEGNYPTHQHPAIHVVPAALAMAEHVGADGRALLEAVVAGYELAGRTGRATRFRDEVMHPHGTHGIVGGAAAAARLLGLDECGIARAVGLATSMSTATSRPTVFEGATIRNTYAGQAGERAVLAAILARAGVTPERDGLGSVFGHVVGHAFDAERFAGGLGTDPLLVTQGYFKLYACCAYNHATLEALRDLTTRHVVDAARVTGVHVRTYYPATRMNRTQVNNKLAAKFSLPYAVAAWLVLGHAEPSAFVEAMRHDPRIQRIMSLVSVEADSAATEAYPNQQRATVQVQLDDGTTLVGEVSTVRGDVGNPVAPDVVREKFDRLTYEVLGDAAVALRDVLSVTAGSSPADIGHAVRSAMPELS